MDLNRNVEARGLTPFHCSLRIISVEVGARMVSVISR
jgi:hypothetical protein